MRAIVCCECTALVHASRVLSSYALLLASLYTWYARHFSYVEGANSKGANKQPYSHPLILTETFVVCASTFCVKLFLCANDETRFFFD